MDAEDLKRLMDEWQEAMRRCSYLEAMRDALPPGPAAHALDEKVTEAQAEVVRLQREVLGQRG